MATTFDVGDMAVYPAQGVTEILGVETLEISGITNQYYVLRCLDSEKKIRVPMANVDQVGLRVLVNEKQVEEVLVTLRAPEIAIEEPNWNRRYRRYVEKMKTGSLHDVAQVLRDLYLTRGEKQLSYGERYVYERAMQLLVQELAIVQSQTEEEVTAQVEQLLG